MPYNFYDESYINWILTLMFNILNVQLQLKITMTFLHGLIVLQVSLRDPLRNGAEDHELREIISAAVCTSGYYY
jgi:hypothetical protein